MSENKWVAITYEEGYLWGNTKEEVISKAKVYIKENCYIPYGTDDNQEDTTPVMIAKIDTLVRAESLGGKIKYIFSKKESMGLHPEPFEEE